MTGTALHQRSDAKIAAGVRPAKASRATQAERRLARAETFLTAAYARAVVSAREAISEDDLVRLINEANGGGLLKGEYELYPPIAWNESQSLDLRVLGQPYVIVHVDVAAFDAAWREHGELYAAPGSQAASPALTEGVARTARQGVFMPPPVVVDLTGDGAWAFINGRNRYLYTRSSGHDTIPLAVPRRDEQRLRDVAVSPPAPAAAGEVLAGVLSRPYADLSDAIAYVGSLLADRFMSAVMAVATATADGEAVRLAVMLADRADARAVAAKLDTSIDFDTPNYGALLELQLASMSLIREITEEQREVILSALRDGVEQGINPREMARLFRSSIGITRTQEGWVQAYRHALQNAHIDPAARANARGRALHDNRFNANLSRASQGQPLSAEKIEQMVDRYRERFVAYRAEVIARTQALRAVHMGEQAVWEEAIRRGDIVAAEVEQTWVTAHDERVRQSHRAMSEQKRTMGKPFTSGLGNALRFPGDPLAPAADVISCRCVLVRQISAEPIGDLGDTSGASITITYEGRS